MNATEKMLEAIKAGDVATVKQLLDADPSLADTRSEGGDSVLLLAVYHGHPEVAELLRERAANLNIFEASAVGDAERIRALVEADASLVHSYAHDGWTPLHLAAFFGHEKATRVLIEKGADFHALSKNDNCNTPLHAAVANRKSNLVKLLLASGVDVNARTGNSWTGLHFAAYAGNKELAQILLARRADVSAKNDKGQTPLAIALEKGHHQVAELLGHRGET